MDDRLLLVLVACFLALAVGNTEELARKKAKLVSRTRRADDDMPFQAVISQQAQELMDLKSQFAALTAQLTTVNTRISDLENIVWFMVRFSNWDVKGLGLNQPVVFDQVDHNVGNGYNSNTGIFTAPAAGTYIFSLAMQRHASDEDTIIMVIKKGNDVIGVAEAGYSPHEHGTMVIGAYLNKGDVISVQATHGSMVWGLWSTVFAGFRVSPH